MIHLSVEPVKVFVVGAQCNRVILWCVFILTGSLTYHDGSYEFWLAVKERIGQRNGLFMAQRAAG